MTQEKTYLEVADRMWEKAQTDLELIPIIQDMIKDKVINRQTLVKIGFSIGAAFAMGEIARGNLKMMPKEEPTK